MTTIRAKRNSAVITFDLPAFIGTTGDDSAGMFPDEGYHHPIFPFAPKIGEIGTLMFDHADPARRNPLSPKLFQYWWQDDELVVREGFNGARYKKSLRVSPGSGFSYFAADPQHRRVYYTGNGDEFKCVKVRVHLLDLLRFIEGKIGDIGLEARAIA